jgi:16S rRNA processing protein RimM
VPQARICVARIGAAHGIGGEVKLWPFTAEREAVGRYGPLETADGGRVLEITSLRSAKDCLIVRFKGFSDRTAAERLCNIDLFVPRERLPPPEADEFYYADLIGLAVEDRAGTTLGRIIAVRNYGAGDLLEIDHGDTSAAGGPGSETMLVPFTAATVPRVDIAAGKVVIDSLKRDSDQPAEDLTGLRNP